jgi:hypothetical protein
MDIKLHAIQVAAGAIWKLHPQLQHWPHRQQQHNSRNSNRMLGSSSNHGKMGEDVMLTLTYADMNLVLASLPDFNFLKPNQQQQQREGH